MLLEVAVTLPGPQAPTSDIHNAVAVGVSLRKDRLGLEHLCQRDGRKVLGDDVVCYGFALHLGQRWIGG